MSYPTDLFPFGEAFAELDLVVRQLDDGSLTVTRDDTLPDSARVLITSGPSGLQASVRVVEASQSDELGAAMDLLSSGALRYVWQSGFVVCQFVLPWGSGAVHCSPTGIV